MKIFFAALFSLATFPALAGDGGYLLQTCVSESGRTNLTILRDGFSGAEVPVKVVFGMDGQFVTYAPRAENCVQEECLYIDDADSLIVGEGDAILLALDLGHGAVTIRRGFFDPRTNRLDNSIGAINLRCKEYIRQP